MAYETITIDAEVKKQLEKIFFKKKNKVKGRYGWTSFLREEILDRHQGVAQATQEVQNGSQETSPTQL
jgi:hypothetical protein